ncbi:MAG: MoaD/ThiS family protein [Phycisphaerales bacterium]|nr:MoaD/ThiS family protein [Phycisphaerales bacterium]
MPTLGFTANLERHLSCPARSCTGATVRDALDDAFGGDDRLRAYVLDEQGAVRRHVMIWVNGRQITDRDRLTDPVGDEDEIFITQALSGG